MELISQYNIQEIRNKFLSGDYAITDHAIIEARKDGIVLKHRKCPECSGDMMPKFINLHYKKNFCEIQVDVIAIPANVCTQCHYRIIPGRIAKYIDSLVDPIFANYLKQKEYLLTPPHIGIQFQPTELNYQRSS